MVWLSKMFGIGWRNCHSLCLSELMGWIMKIEVLALIAMGLIVFGVHAAGWDWAAIANNMAHAHPMSLMYIHY